MQLVQPKNTEKRLGHSSILLHSSEKNSGVQRFLLQMRYNIGNKGISLCYFGKQR